MPLKLCRSKKGSANIGWKTETGLWPIPEKWRTKEMRFRIKYNAPVILTFAILCTMVLAFSEITGYKYTPELFVTHRGSLSNPMTYITMFTYVLGHASIEHFIGNMMLLLLTGPVGREIRIKEYADYYSFYGASDGAGQYGCHNQRADWLQRYCLCFYHSLQHDVFLAGRNSFNHDPGRCLLHWAGDY